MINAIALVFIENAFFQWLFDYAPKTALAGMCMWVFLRWANKYGDYKARFVRIESEIDDLIVEVKGINVELHSMNANFNARLGKLEGQMEVVINLLKSKK